MIEISNLKAARKVLSVRALAEEAGIPYATLDSKLRHDRDLTTTESKNIVAALKKFGLYFSESKTESQRQ